MESASQSSREQILERIRNALRARVPLPASRAEPRGIFSPIPSPLERFAAECAANYTELTLTANRMETVEALTKILGELPVGEIYVQDVPELRELITRADGREVKWSSQGPPSEASQATITQAEALVAITGSILVSSVGCGGRGSSIVAPCHIVIARLQQLVPDLERALAMVTERGLPARSSFVGLITGCSRTADIEKLLVIGAHGPRRLVVILQQ
ncbi:MAG TPA: LUD domain-containing protein [Terriglobales bacterium]|nr:LUD domain-containing protein [Terriglobales bacterium]